MKKYTRCIFVWCVIIFLLASFAIPTVLAAQGEETTLMGLILLKSEASAVEGLIEEIGFVFFDGTAIFAAREAYDQLTEEAQSLVENYDTLVAAETLLVVEYIVLVVIVCFIATLYMIWIYRTTDFLNRAPTAQCNPTSALFLCIFVPFYQIFWFYKHGQKIDEISRQKELNKSDIATLCLILGIFLPLVACFVIHDRIKALRSTKSYEYHYNN